MIAHLAGRRLGTAQRRVCPLRVGFATALDDRNELVKARRALVAQETIYLTRLVGIGVVQGGQRVVFHAMLLETRVARASPCRRWVGRLCRRGRRHASPTGRRC